MHDFLKTALALVFMAAWGLDACADSTAPISVGPSAIELDGHLDRVQFQVANPDGSSDLTRSVDYTLESGHVVAVDALGRVTPLADGETAILVKHADYVSRIPVTVTGMTETPVSFREDVTPILTKAGCNQGACHASQYGKGNFKLSLLGFAPEQDHSQFVRDWKQRRINFVQPEHSLVLRKATAQVSHGGGMRFRTDSYEHGVLLDWLKAGAPKPNSADPHVVGMTVTPADHVYKPGESQQLRVVATYSDGTQRDVTHRAVYDSMGESTASVDGHGLITGHEAGQAAIMIRYQGQAKISMVQIPSDRTPDLTKFTRRNFIDDKLADHWQKLGLQPVENCSDEVFIRRAFLDSIGTLPSPEKIEAFLASDKPDKREELVNELLGLTGDSERDVYVGDWSAYWALKWGDLLRNNRNKVGDGGMWALYNWMRSALRENMPVDQFVREIITAQGSIYANGPANYFKIATKPDDLAETTAQVFLGVRLQCAKCHHHPFEVYSQADYYGLAAFFTRVSTKASADFGALGRDTVVMLKSSGSISHPRTRKTMHPTPLLGEPADLEGVRDLRRPLAVWLTARENKLFARNIVNRIWGYFMGSGLVEPIDDMRATNPASIPPLLDALADDFIASEFNLRHLMRQIMTSQAYQLSSTPLAENVRDTRFYLHYNVKRLPAEVMLDAIDDACGTQERFAGVPLGMRAIELPDSNYNSYFLTTTGRPKRAIACECERVSDPNLAAILHLINGELVTRKLTDKNGRLSRMINDKTSADEAVTELYLVTFSRPPSEDELVSAREFVDNAESTRQGLEDVLWALINSREFLFNH